MAFLTSGQISRVAVELLRRRLVLPSTVLQIPGGEYAGDNGDTVTLRVPVNETARTQANPGDAITFDEISETSVDVTLSHLYHGTNITDEDLTLNIVDFARQVTTIQVDAVATGAEDELATVMNGLAADDSIAVDGSDVETKIMQARETLGRNNVPPGDRWLAVSPEVATYLLTTTNLSFADAAASDSALRDAVIGRYRGFMVVESNALDAGTALAYHRSSFAWANRVPVVPRGAADSSVANDQGIGLRHILQYQASNLRDQSVLSTFVGSNVVDTDRVYKLDTAVS